MSSPVPRVDAAHASRSPSSTSPSPLACAASTTAVPSGRRRHSASTGRPRGSATSARRRSPPSASSVPSPPSAAGASTTSSPPARSPAASAAATSAALSVPLKLSGQTTARPATRGAYACGATRSRRRRKRPGRDRGAARAERLRPSRVVRLLAGATVGRRRLDQDRAEGVPGAGVAHTIAPDTLIRKPHHGLERPPPTRNRLRAVLPRSAGLHVADPDGGRGRRGRKMRADHADLGAPRIARLEPGRSRSSSMTHFAAAGAALTAAAAAARRIVTVRRRMVPSVVSLLTPGVPQRFPATRAAARGMRGSAREDDGDADHLHERRCGSRARRGVRGGARGCARPRRRARSARDRRRGARRGGGLRAREPVPYGRGGEPGARRRASSSRRQSRRPARPSPPGVPPRTTSGSPRSARPRSASATGGSSSRPRSRSRPARRGSRRSARSRKRST